MKRAFFLLLAAAILMSNPLAAHASGTYEGEGVVESADPLYQRITIRHGAIKGFAGEGTTEFVVADTALIRNLSRRDLVKFTVNDQNNDASITAIEKTGVEPPAEPSKLGQIVHETLVVTGGVAKEITKPLPPAHEVVSGAVGATTDTTGAVLDNAAPDSKSEF